MDAMQPGALERVGRALAIYPIIVWRILHRAARGRDRPSLPCGAAFDPRNGGASPPAPPSSGEVVHPIAGFGGFPGRKSEDHLGPKAIWEGMQCV